MAKTPTVYPTTLPCPTSAPMQWAERRSLSDLPGLRANRILSRDQHGPQRLTFKLRTEAQVQAWLDWGNDALGEWAHWFAAHWPQPQGGVGVRHFVGVPSYPEYMPVLKAWVVTADVEIRGRGELPMRITSNCTEAIAAIEVAQGEIPLVFQYWGSDPLPPPVTAGEYVVKGRDPGAVGPDSTFPTSFSTTWGDLADPSVVNLYSTTRVGTGSSGVSLLLTVTDLPTSGVRCKSVLYLNDGHWTNDDGSVSNGGVTVNGEFLGFSTFYPPPDPGTGYLIGSILLRVENGELTASLL